MYVFCLLLCGFALAFCAGSALLHSYIHIFKYILRIQLYYIIVGDICLLIHRSHGRWEKTFTGGET